MEIDNLLNIKFISFDGSNDNVIKELRVTKDKKYECQVHIISWGVYKELDFTFINDNGGEDYISTSSEFFRSAKFYK